MSLDAEERMAKLQGGDEVDFEKALIATGANVNILRVDGAEQEGIHYLRAFGNSDAIREAAEKAERVVLIGGSYIGCEVAASLTAKGTDCAIVMMEDVALSRTFGEDAGRYFQEVLESKGVEFHGGETLAAFEGDGGVSAVVTESGKTVEGDFVVIGAGVKPDVMLAREGRPEVDDGIICDRDAADLGRGHLRGRRRLLLRQRDPRPAAPGRALGRRHAAGPVRGGGLHGGRSARPTRWCPTSSATSPTGRASSTSGRPRTGTRRSGAATRDAGEFCVLYLKDGKVAGALSVERSEDLAAARELLANGVDVSAKKDVLADPDSDLGQHRRHLRLAAFAAARIATLPGSSRCGLV